MQQYLPTCYHARLLYREHETTPRDNASKDNSQERHPRGGHSLQHQQQRMATGRRLKPEKSRDIPRYVLQDYVDLGLGSMLHLLIKKATSTR